MKKLFYMGMGLCLLATLFVGCEEKPLDEPAVAEAPTEDVGENYLEKAFGMELQMVYVEGGTFMMGATEEQGEDAKDDEKPVHKVTLDDFYIGKYEVTQAQWEAVMGTTVEQQRGKADRNRLYGVGDNYPMYYINWEEVNEFCAKLSMQTGKKYRLPTEAEWEYAARGGQKADGTKYAGSDDVDEVAWNDGNSNGKTHLVGQKKSNGLGLYDMSGNIAEMCSDSYEEDYYSSSPSENPQGPSVNPQDFWFVRRGGSWCGQLSGFRVSCRGADTPDCRDEYMGFRVVCER